MTVYPSQIDDDVTLIRVDDNISELGSQAINQIRESIFAIEKTLGINPQGSKSSLNERISVLIDSDGYPKESTFSELGLVTLPITNVQIASNAGIVETKLTLDYSTSDLNTRISALETTTATLSLGVSTNESDILLHKSGATKLSDGTTLARHVASHIDINSNPSDSRDITYTWTGLLDKEGDVRTSATTVASALLVINNELVEHENAEEEAHPATAITVDGSDFTEIPTDIGDAQAVFEYLDQRETISTGLDRATLNSNGIPRTSRSQDINDGYLDGYNTNIVPLTKAVAYLGEPDQAAPLDSINIGDDIIKFLPEDNSDYSFDAQFANVKVGDIIRLNYGNGLAGEFPIKSIRFIPGSEWVVRINSFNLRSLADEVDTFYARIDKAKFDTNTWGVLAAAGVYPDVTPDTVCANAYDSVILGSPRGAVAVGIGFDPSKIDGNHHLLYLRMYLDGTADNYYDLPAIDVSGDLGASKGKYTIDRIVEATNAQFRQAGYNYRFIAFNQKGEFGIMLADCFNDVAFSIISGDVNGTSLEEGSYIQNVIADATDGYDALGLGGTRAGFASPVASSGYSSAIAAASYPTLILSPVKDRNVLINGTRRDSLGVKEYTEVDGYWNATVTNVLTSVVDSTKLIEYTINTNLITEEIKPGKTIVVQPSTEDAGSSIIGFGRFIIGDVSYGTNTTSISVINGVHGSTNPLGSSSAVGDEVKIYLTEDSVPINILNVVGDSNDYHRYNEIYVTNIGESFALERARMPKQSQSGYYLGTNLDGWRIRNVSSKLKGYRDGSSSDFRYYVRFFISNYNQKTGEYDGYIGEPVGTSGITNIGPIVRGRKDRPIRYYDNSFVDYIEIEFREDGTYPGSVLLPDSYGRFVDIEVFSTLKAHDEHFIVAGVSHNEKRLTSVTDLREFGTLSEENFTDSAIKFIESGERHLHANGVVRGFAYEGIGNTASVFEFTGGTALVNGAFVSVDSLDVKIPEIKTSASDIVEFFICVNETGQLQAVIKDTGTQFFEETSQYFVETLTFKEIVDKRKDLTIIARIKATIADADGTVSYNLTEVTDARRFLINQDINDFSLAISDEQDGYNATFVSSDSLMNWVNEYGVSKVNVKYVETDSQITLSFSNPVELIGGVYKITTSTGLAFTSGNWKIKDASIYYYPSSDFVAVAENDIFNVESSAGAIFVGESITSNIEDFGIENSYFWSLDSQRPPFVGFYGVSNTFKNGIFINNRFKDMLATNALAISFVNSDPSTSITAPTLENIVIKDNVGYDKQGVLISSRAVVDTSSSTGAFLAINKSNVGNVIIKDNEFGLIGLLVGGDGVIKIIDNTADCILSGVTGTLHTVTETYALGIVDNSSYHSQNIVRGNSANYIKIEGTAGTAKNKSIISENIVKRSSDELFNLIIPAESTDILNKYGITIVNGSFDVSNIVCSGNVVDGMENGYTRSIFVEGGATINNNIITNIPNAGTGIYSTGLHTEQPTTIVGNSLEKEDDTEIVISAFINSNTDAAIYGNNFSHFNLNYQGPGDGYDGYDGYSTSDVFVADFNGIRGGNVWAAHNVNQVSVVGSELTSATPILNNTPSDASIGITEDENDKIETWVRGDDANIGLDRVYYDKSAGAWQWEWTGTSLALNDGGVGLVIPMDAIIPSNAHLLSFSINVTLGASWGVYLSSGTSNTFPALVLEVGGIQYSIRNITDGGFYNLVYRSSSLLYNERPINPRTAGRDIVIRTKQGVSTSPTTYGSRIGPTSASTMTISKPVVTLLY